MIVDSLLQYSTDQALTATAVSEDSIDLGPGASRDVGTGKLLFLVVLIKVAFTDAGSDTAVDVAMEGDSAESITPDASDTLMRIPALAAIGDVFYRPLPPGLPSLQYRYTQLRYTMVNGNLTTGTVDAFLTTDIDRWKAYPNAFEIAQ